MNIAITMLLSFGFAAEAAYCKVCGENLGGI